MTKPVDSIQKLIDIVSQLRNPEGGCPWDLAQTPNSIKGHIIEEAYEVIDTIAKGDFDHLKEELGDLLLQIVLLCEMSTQSGNFNVTDVAEEISAKLIRRHPHIFNKDQQLTAKQVLMQWEQIKKQEKEHESFLSGVLTGFPALLYSQKLQSKAARVGFDWEKDSQVLEKIEEEIQELKDGENVEEEIGDILFSIVNLARRKSIDAESALFLSAQKFKKRFIKMEEVAIEQGKKFEDLSLDEMDELWNKVKEML